MSWDADDARRERYEQTRMPTREEQEAEREAEEEAFCACGAELDDNGDCPKCGDLIVGFTQDDWDAETDAGALDEEGDEP